GSVEIKRAGGVPNVFGSPPASADTGYQACNGRLRGWASASLRCASTAAPPKSCRVVRFSQLRRPAALLPIRGFMLRVGAGIRAGTSGSGDRTFSSDSTLASPGFRASFVLRDPGHIKGSTDAQPDLHKTKRRS